MGYKTEEELEQQIAEMGIEINEEFQRPGRLYIEYTYKDRRLTASGATRRNALMSVVTFSQQWKQE